jgi:transcriptional regulator with XRE-family HTH domain
MGAAMGQVPRELTPSRSARDLFGAELRYWRERAGLSQARLGKVVLHSGDLIARVEKAERWPSPGMAEACDAALGTGGVLGRMWPAVEQQRRREIEEADIALADADANSDSADGSGGTPAKTVLLRADEEGHLWVSLGRQLLPGGAAAPVPPGAGAPAGLPRVAADDLSATDPLCGRPRPCQTVGCVLRPLAGSLAPLPGCAYRQGHGTGPDAGGVDGQAGMRHEVDMTAQEGSEHADQREIGEATLAQLRAEVIRLSHELMTGAPFPLFQQMRRVRTRIYAALDRRLWPRDHTELHFLLGCLNNLMAVAAKSLGCSQAAEELLRAGWAYAVAIDHRPLMAHLRLQLASIAYWQDRTRQSQDLARSGLEYLSDGPDAAHLHLVHARAAARLGDGDTARSAITAAGEARAREHHDELLDIGGMFGLSRATQQWLAGSTLVEIPDAAAEAVTELERATSLYAAGPEPGEGFAFECEAMAHVDLAAAQLRAGVLDAATTALEPTLSLPPGQRTDGIVRKLGWVRAELARPRYHGEASVSSLDERIEDFTAHSVVNDLSDLPGHS